MSPVYPQGREFPLACLFQTFLPALLQKLDGEYIFGFSQGHLALQGKHNLRNVHFVLVLKGNSGGSLKNNLANKNNPQGQT